MIFSSKPALIAMERMMTQPPFYRPRGHGKCKPKKLPPDKAHYKCEYCLHYDRKDKCKLVQCPYMDERIKAGAVSLAVLMTGGMDKKDFGCYAAAQCLGALAASACLALIFSLGAVKDMTGGFGANGLGGVNGSAVAGLLVEILLTFIFVLVILGVTSKKGGHGSFAGVVIGFSLTLVHILGIGLTGTSVNPARSFGPALVAAFAGNSAPIAALWVFIVGPFVGAALAALVWKKLDA